MIDPDAELEIAEENACGMLVIMAEQERYPNWPDTTTDLAAD